MTEKKRQIYVLENLAQVTEMAVDAFQKIADEAIREKGSFTVAFSGGKTPVMFYEKLAQIKRSPIWDASDFFLVDERFLPYDHEESNYGLLKRTFLEHRCGEKEHFHKVFYENETCQSAAEKYEAELKQFFQLKEGELPRFDLIMLGLGSDGHTASLFPHCQCIKDKVHLTVKVLHDDFDRVSLTLPVINNAKNVLYLISGDSKQEAVKGVVEDKDESYPAALVDPHDGDMFYLLDEAAAALLSKEVIT